MEVARPVSQWPMANPPVATISGTPLAQRRGCEEKRLRTPQAGPSGTENPYASFFRGLRGPRKIRSPRPRQPGPPVERLVSWIPPLFWSLFFVGGSPSHPKKDALRGRAPWTKTRVLSPGSDLFAERRRGHDAAGSPWADLPGRRPPTNSPGAGLGGGSGASPQNVLSGDALMTHVTPTT